MPLLLCSGIIVNAQTSEEEVMKPVNDMFKGMELADSAMVKSAFSTDAKMFTAYTNKKGEEVVTEGSLDKFVHAIATKPKDSPKWIEKLYNTEVKIDGNIAQVWTEYSFFLDKQFLHCGVDAFQLIKKDGEWKIIHIMDTRRKKGCDSLK